MDREEAYRVMDLKALRCLWALGKRGSLTGAGIELGISEPAVSKRIRALESYLGTKVAESRGGRIRLTPAGHKVFDMAVELFDRLDNFELELTGQEVSGTVTLCAQDPIQFYVLPTIVERFTKEYPRMRLRLVNRTQDPTVQLVRRNEADVGIISHGSLPEGLVFHPLRTYPAYLLLPLGHALVRRGKPAIHDLLTYDTVMRYPFIVPAEDPGYQRALREALLRQGLPLNVAFEVGTCETAKRYVAMGLGVAVVPGIYLTDEDRRQMVAMEIPKEFGGETTYGCVLREDKYLGAALKGLLRIIGVGGGSVGPHQLHRPMGIATSPSK